GAHRFLQRIWRLGSALHEAPPTAPADGELERRRQVAVERVTRSFRRCRLNTAVAAVMELSSSLAHALEGQTASRLRCDETFDTLLQLLHPLAPHMTEELWERRDHVETLLDTSWPEYDESKLSRPRVRWAVQVDGRMHGRVDVQADASEKETRAAALASPRIKEHLAGREVAKAVFVPGRLINLVTRRSA
ncbi:MAG TPA: class I tRNA ligase family protein, partial [Thermoanaerobaculia bacterium]